MQRRSRGVEIINLGYNNAVLKNRVVTIVSVGANPVKRLIEAAKKENKLIDATSGRKTRSLVVTDAGFFILSSLQPQRLIERVGQS